jgi:hypothetical protein
MKPREKVFDLEFFGFCRIWGKVLHESNFVVNIGTRRRGTEDLHSRWVKAKYVDDIGTDLWGGGRRKSTDGHHRVCQGTSEPRQVLVGRTEIMTPLADTMGFVDGDANQLSLSVDGFEVSSECLCLAEFWRHIQKTRFWVPRE